MSMRVSFNQAIGGTKPKIGGVTKYQQLPTLDLAQLNSGWN